MAITKNTYTGNGTNKLFSISFEYLNPEDVDVYVNDVLQTITTQYSFANATTIEFVTAPANGATVVLNRTTDDTAFQATFFPGSSIKAADLNDNFDQVLFISQEAANLAEESITDSATALANSTTALATANSADDKADIALNSVSSLIDYAPVLDLAALGALTPVNGNFYELANSTGIEGSSLVQSVPAGFVGAAGLSVRLKYEVPPSKFTFLSYYANDSETRYVKTSTGGTAAAPAYAFNADTNTGVFRPAADTVAVSTNSTERMRIGSTGQVAIGNTTWTGNGADNPTLSVSANLSGYNCLMIGDYGTGTGARGGTITGARQNPSNAPFTALGTWDNGSARYVDIGGGGWGTPESTILSFSTAPTYTETANTGLQRMVITGDGYVRLTSNSSGIQFNGDTAAANALDDYEEGTWTPTVIGSSTAGTATHSAQNGRYTKVGRLVTIELFVSWSSGTGTGDLRISGLPFALNSADVYTVLSIGYISSLTLSANQVPAAYFYDNADTFITLGQLPVGGGSVTPIAYDASASIGISGTYSVA